MATNGNQKRQALDQRRIENFKRLAQSRVTNVIRTLRILGNLSNTSNYVYTEDQVGKIFAALREELDLVERKFEAGARRAKEQPFKL